MKTVSDIALYIGMKSEVEILDRFKGIKHRHTLRGFRRGRLDVFANAVKFATDSDPFGKERTGPNVRARTLYFYLCSVGSYKSLAEIGRVSGRGYSHCSVIHHRRVARELIDTDPTFRRDLSEVCRMIEMIYRRDAYDSGI